MELVVIPGKMWVKKRNIPKSLMLKLISNTDFPHDKSYKISIATMHNYAEVFCAVQN